MVVILVGCTFTSRRNKHKRNITHVLLVTLVCKNKYRAPSRKGCERFHLHLYGADFEIVTDHKPLELIFNNPNSKPPARIQRWALRLQAYTFTVRYKPGPTNIADYLSRHPLPSQPRRERLIAEEYVNYLVGHDVPKAMTLREINLACQTDPIMQRLRQAITTGVWPADDPDLMPFWKVQLELTAANDSDIILRGTRIILPQSL